MALLIKRTFQGYFYIMHDLADPRSDDLFLMSSPLPTIGIVTLWFMFIFKWGPEYMKDKEPFVLKKVMIAYNVFQVLANLYILYLVSTALHIVDWRCTEIDYSRSYWGLLFLDTAHNYYLLKVIDLIDTVFFVLRKKTNHISFLHVYHHFGMCVLGWIGTRFIGGGHVYFLGLANCIVHTLLYSYYLLTAYDSRYSKLLWLKKFITQAQLFQFVFLLYMFGQLLFVPNCKFPKILTYFFIPQNAFMIVLFGEFYVRTYHLEPRRKRKALEEKKKLQELQETNRNPQGKKGKKVFTASS